MNYQQKGALTCEADGYTYQITGDERNLYFHKIGRVGAESDGSIMGTMRVVKAEVEAVRCTRVSGQTVVLVVFEGKTSRLVVKGAVKEPQLMEVFSGVPLKLSLNLHSNVLTEQYELRLLSAAFIVAILRFLCMVMPEIAFLAPVVRLGWVVIPFMWLIPCAGRMLKGGLRDQFPVGAGMLATVFSCAFLWVGAFSERLNWLTVILPTLAVALAVGATYHFTRKKADWKSVAVVTLVAMVLYAAPAATAVNALIPLRQQRTTVQVEALEKSSMFGIEGYHVVANVDGEKTRFGISQTEFEGLTEGDRIELVEAIGLLGIRHTDVDAGSPSADASKLPVSP